MPRLLRAPGFWLLAAGCAVSSHPGEPPRDQGTAGTAGTAGTDGFFSGEETGGCPAASSAYVADAAPPDESPDPLCEPAVPPVSFATVGPLVGCSGKICHAAWTYDTLVGPRSSVCCDARLLVVPGRPSESHLVQTLLGTSPCIGRMPLGRTPLSDEKIAEVVAWVCQGAARD